MLNERDLAVHDAQTGEYGAIVSLLGAKIF